MPLTKSISRLSQAGVQQFLFSNNIIVSVANAVVSVANAVVSVSNLWMHHRLTRGNWGVRTIGGCQQQHPAPSCSSAPPPNKSKVMLIDDSKAIGTLKHFYYTFRSAKFVVRNL